MTEKLFTGTLNHNQKKKKKKKKKNNLLISELGDKHSQEHPGILSFSVLFFRWHNFLADKFMQEGSEGVDHTFAKTRHWVIASLQVHTCIHLIILACPCNVTSVNHLFSLTKLGFAKVDIIFLIFPHNIDCCCLLEPPQ